MPVVLRPTCVGCFIKMKSYEQFLENSQEAILIIDRSNSIVFANKSAASALRSKASGDLIGGNAIMALGKVLDGISIQGIILLPEGAILHIGASEPNGNLSMMIHQLKAPMAALKWIIEDMLDDDELKPHQEERLKTLHKTNQFLITLVNDLLNVYKLEMGTFKIEKTKNDLLKIIEDMIVMLKPSAEQNKQIIILKSERDQAEALLDPRLFSFAFESLLENAINYGAPNSEIAINVIYDQDAGRFIASVNNRGSVISDEDKIKLFQKFYRGEVGRKSKPSGSGLGLYIAKLATEANGGEIWLDSSLEKGTTFYLSYPQAWGGGFM